MAVSSSPATAPPPSKPPVGAPPAKAVPPSAPSPSPRPPPRAGTIQDQGIVRRDSVHALRWSSQGRTKVLNEVDCGEAVLVGGTAIGGAFTADSVRSEGDLAVGAAMTVVGAVRSSGTLRARGDVHWGEADVRGRTRLDGMVRIDRGLSVQGLFVAPSVHAGEFSLVGVAEIDGPLEADRVNARFRGPGRIGRIRAKSVVLSVRPPNPVEMVLGRNLAVRIARIEADTVDLEGVNVELVRAREIVLGRDAHVTELEGHVARRHASAHVGPESKSPPPHGLTR
ncbi:MAG: hypothetical protein ACLPZM_06920 [Thermoplasmata archaeon]